AFCGEASELGDEMMEVVQTMNDKQEVAKLRSFGKVCDSYGDDSANQYLPTAGGGKNSKSYAKSPYDLCTDDTYFKKQTPCVRYLDLKEKYPVCKDLEALDNKIAEENAS